jgi:hypothetical protein
MEALATVTLLHMATAPRFPDANAVDRYYQAHDLGEPPRVVPFGSMATIIGLIFFVLVLVPL